MVETPQFRYHSMYAAPISNKIRFAADLTHDTVQTVDHARCQVSRSIGEQQSERNDATTTAKPKEDIDSRGRASSMPNNHSDL